MTPIIKPVSRERVRAAAIAIKSGHILLMRRERSGFGVYYVIPGGGVEPGENPAQAVLREIREETGLTSSLKRLVFTGLTPTGHRQYYYLVNLPFRPVSLPKNSEEASRARIKKRGTTAPIWLKLSRLRLCRLLPTPIKKNILTGIKNGFPKPAKYLGRL